MNNEKNFGQIDAEIYTENLNEGASFHDFAKYTISTIPISNRFQTDSHLDHTTYLTVVYLGLYYYVCYYINDALCNGHYVMCHPP